MKTTTTSDVRIFFRTMLSYTLGFSILIVFVPVLMFIALLPKSQRYESRLLYRVADFLYKGVMWATLMPVDIEGFENFPQEPAIIIANHQSSLDIPIIGSVLDARPHVWLALIDFMTTPILGYLIKQMGVWVDRRTSIAGARTVLQAVQFANEHKAHIVIFPEGTRHADGKVHEFLRGFALIARKSQRQVVPIYMPNNWRIYPRGSFLLGYDEIKVVIGPAFTLQEGESAEAFVQRIHAWFDEKVHEMHP